MGVRRRPRAEPRRRRAGRAQRAVVGDAARRPGAATRRAGSTSTGTAADGKVILPVLGDPLDDVVDSLEIVDGELHLGEQRCPLRRGHRRAGAGRRRSTASTTACSTGDSPTRNVRRFFTIDDLVAVRVEDPDVAAAVDTVPRLLADHAAFAGVRVDHVDGLADPLGLPRRAARRDRRRSLAARREDPRRRRAAAGRRGRSTGRPATSTPRSLEHALLDRGRLGPAARGAGSPRPATTGRSATGSSTPAGRCSTAGLRPDLERVARVAADRLEADGDGRSGGRRAQRAPRPLPHVPPRRRGRTGADARPGAGRGEPAATWPRPRSARHRAARQRRRRGRSSGARAGSSSPARRRPRASRTGRSGATCRWRRSTRSAGAPSPTPTSIRSPRCTSTTRRPRRGGRRRCSPARPTTPSGPRTCGPPAWRSPRGSRGSSSWSTSGSTVPASRFAIDLAIQWLALQTVATTPGLDGSTAARVPRQGRPGGRRAHAWTDPDEPYERQLGRLADVLLQWPPAAELQADLDGPGRAMTLAMLAVRLTAPGVRRPLPGHGGVPLPARRPGQPAPSRTTTRSTRSSTRPLRSTAGRRGPSRARRRPGPS